MTRFTAYQQERHFAAWCALYIMMDVIRQLLNSIPGIPQWVYKLIGHAYFGQHFIQINMPFEKSLLQFKFELYPLYILMMPSPTHMYMWLFKNIFLSK